jgi:hypothetical protein
MRRLKQKNIKEEGRRLRHKDGAGTVYRNWRNDTNIT